MQAEGPTFSPEPLQNIVERLASVIQRAVAVDDGELRLLAHSTHFGDEDEVRVQSLVGRRVSDVLMEWARQNGVMRATAPYYTPSAPELGLKSRYVAPVRVDRELAAVIWVIDDHTLTAEELDAVDRAVEDIRTVLVRRAASFEDDVRQMEAHVLGLLSDRLVDRQDAVDEVEAVGTFRGCVAFQVINVHVAVSAGDLRTGGANIPRRVIERALVQRASGLAVARTDETTIVVVGYPAPPTDDQVTGVLAAIERAVGTLGDALAGPATVGIGAVVPSLENVFASNEQAALAVRVARGRGEPSTSWATAGLDGMIAALLPERVAGHLIPTALTGALAEQSEENILAVRSYLANAGNVVKTSAELHVHRTTVYYRLTRFTETTGLDLEDGDTRLMLHLWFRMRAFVDITPG